jgi:REP element-mobilizing transposase RayT
VFFHHVTARGNRRQPIFFDDDDRARFLRYVERVLARFAWSCHAYCLMLNHYHLLLETPEPESGPARGMLVLNGSYARYLNRRHGLSGHVFQGPYHDERVQTDEHLMEVCRYIVRNPVRAGLVEHPGDWRWSSFRATAGLERRPPWLTVNLVRELFGSTRRYMDFCNQVAEEPRPISRTSDDRAESGLAGSTNDA